MTRKEANIEIGTKNWSLFTILKTSAEVFFENMPRWFLLCLIGVAPVSFAAQYLLSLLPMQAWMNSLAGLIEKVQNGSILMTGNVLDTSGLDALIAFDWSPLLWMLLIELGVSLISVIVYLAACCYVDAWLQVDVPEPGVGKLLLAAIRRWPKALLFQILLVLLCFVVFLVSLAVPMLGIAMVLIGAVLAVSMYYVGLSLCAIRKIPAGNHIKQTFRALFNKGTRTIGVALFFAILRALIASLVDTATSYIVFDGSQVLLACLCSAVTSAISALGIVFAGFGVTFRYINQEQYRPENIAPEQAELQR